jgi:AraC family transcriptional regulator, transcriptional activator of pobA
MPGTVIPIHHLPVRDAFPTRIERILAAKGPVHNSVHRHDFHEVFFFAKGSGTHMIDLEHVAVKPPCVHLVGPGQVHQLDRSADCTGVVVMFMPDASQGPQRLNELSNLFIGGSGSPSFAIDDAMMAEVNTLVELMDKELSRSEGPVQSIVQSYLGILLMKCVHWRRIVQPDHTLRADASDPVRRFANQVEQEFLEKRQVAAYAEDLALTPGHLNELVKKRLGKSASEVIHERVLLEAKRLLLHADLSVKEVGYALRMQDPAYFNRMFKKATGMTPVEYRAHIREKYHR